MSEAATTPPTLFWIRAEIRDCYPQDKAERLTEPSSLRIQEKERLLRRIAAEIQAAALKGKTPDLIKPLRIERVDTTSSASMPQLRLFDANRTVPSASLQFQSDDIYQIAIVAVAHLKKRYQESVWAIAEHLIAREELSLDDLTAEEAYVFHEKRLHIENARERSREFAHQQSV